MFSIKVASRANGSKWATSRVWIFFELVRSHQRSKGIHILYLMLVASENLCSWSQLVLRSKSLTHFLVDHVVPRSIINSFPIWYVVRWPVAPSQLFCSIAFDHKPGHLFHNLKKSFRKSIINFEFFGINHHILIIICSRVPRSDNISPLLSICCQSIRTQNTMPCEKCMGFDLIKCCRVKNSICSLQHNELCLVQEVEVIQRR
mmetsp:Transcript_14397/g.21874  ORF Transcript_14397/g.21874 Transcript_14397/m.21874 type:complete len:203 (-) Transcript_14397:862-1470(-)